MATLMSLSPSHELTDCGVHIAMLWPLRTKRTLHFVFPGVLVQINKMQEMQRYVLHFMHFIKTSTSALKRSSSNKHIVKLRQGSGKDRQGMARDGP